MECSNKYPKHAQILALVEVAEKIMAKNKNLDKEKKDLISSTKGETAYIKYILSLMLDNTKEGE